MKISFPLRRQGGITFYTFLLQYVKVDEEELRQLKEFMAKFKQVEKVVMGEDKVRIM